MAVLAGALAVLTPSSAAADEPPPLSGTRQPSSFAWHTAVIDLPWAEAVLKDGSVCPGGRIDFNPAPDNASYGTATVGDFTYHISLKEYGGVTKASAKEAIVELSCGRTGTTISAAYYYLYYFHCYCSTSGPYGSYRPEVRDFLTSADTSSSSTHLVTFIDGRLGAVDVRHFLYQRGTWLRTFTWTEGTFVADKPLPYYPEADTPPV